MSVCYMHNDTSEENNHRQVCIAAIMMNGDREGAEAEGWWECCVILSLSVTMMTRWWWCYMTQDDRQTVAVAQWSADEEYEMEDERGTNTSTERLISSAPMTVGLVGGLFIGMCHLLAYRYSPFYIYKPLDVHVLREENFRWNSNFAISLMATWWQNL